MTQLEIARLKKISPEMEIVAKNEYLKPEDLRKLIAKGRTIIPANKIHLQKGLNAMAIGEMVKTKINVNLGTSKKKCDFTDELEKVKIALKFGADTIMDLSTGEGINELRQIIIDQTHIPVGTVPVYQLFAEKKNFFDATEKDFLNCVEDQAKNGVDYQTIHAGVVKKNVVHAKNRMIGIVSRGGGLIARWMEQNNRENPFYECFDDLLEIAFKYDVTLSLGDALRPGCLHDATDAAQIGELKTLGELTKIAWKKNVQVMIEGPGHVPIHEIKKNVELQKKLCHNAPFYVLGPLVTDIGASHDHITAAIGAAVAGMHGVAFLCYVTPAEHLALPNVDDVKEGTIAYKIAAHAADIAKGLPHAMDIDNKMSIARREFDWETMFKLSVDPEKAREYREKSGILEDEEYCTMCGQLCPMKVYKKHDASIKIEEN